MNQLRPGTGVACFLSVNESSTISQCVSAINLIFKLFVRQIPLATMWFFNCISQTQLIDSMAALWSFQILRPTKYSIQTIWPYAHQNIWIAPFRYIRTRSNLKSTRIDVPKMKRFSRSGTWISFDPQRVPLFSGLLFKSASSHISYRQQKAGLFHGQFRRHYTATLWHRPWSAYKSKLCHIFLKIAGEMTNAAAKQFGYFRWYFMLALSSIQILRLLNSLVHTVHA